MSAEIVEFVSDLHQRQIRELRHCRSISEVMFTRQFCDLTQLVRWVDGQDAGLGAVLLLCARVSKKNKGGFLRSWGRLSVDKRPAGIDIVESRFVNLIRAGDWDDFYNAAEIGVKLLRRRDGAVDVVDMIRWIKHRAEEWAGITPTGVEQFALRAADVFYAAQKADYDK